MFPGQPGPRQMCLRDLKRLSLSGALGAETRHLRLVAHQIGQITHQAEEIMRRQGKVAKSLVGAALLLGLLVVGTIPGFAREKNETIDATAFGTGTQMGQNIGVTLNIYEFSTPADKQILVQAYQQGQNKGLTNALQKMKAVGHVEITGTLGNDCSYISMTRTPTGRKIVFVTNRQIRMA